MTNRDTLTEMYSFSPGGVCIVYLEFVKLASSCQTLNWLNESVFDCVCADLSNHACSFMEDTLCTLHMGFQRKKDFFSLCNIKLLCISLLPVYFIKVLQNY